MNSFSFGKYAIAPYNIISQEFSGNTYFHKKSINVLILITVIGFLFLNLFFMFFIAFILFISFSRNNKLSKIASIVLYGIDYSIIKQLEKKGKISIPQNIYKQFPTKAYIQNDLMIPVANTPKSPHSTPPHDEIKEKEPELNFDFSDFSGDMKDDSKNSQMSSPNPNKNTTKRKSVFDDYVSVKDLFKEMKKR